MIYHVDYAYKQTIQVLKKWKVKFFNNENFDKSFRDIHITFIFWHLIFTMWHTDLRKHKPLRKLEKKSKDKENLFSDLIQYLNIRIVTLKILPSLQDKVVFFLHIQLEIYFLLQVPKILLYSAHVQLKTRWNIIIKY